jgi:two-component system cell cycle sensor histidine kinase/response regulator CckA
VPCILVVDDEELIRGLVQRVLERRGYTVVACHTAAEALAQSKPFDLLLVDLILPEMVGRELAETLRLRCPGLPVVLMSGYLPADIEMLPPPALFLQKPMLPGAVIDAVEALLAPSEQPEPS